MKNIILENISQSTGDGFILNNLSLEIPSGEFFALLGPSGCGKTTLLRLIAGLEKLQVGSIYLGSEDISHLPVHKRDVNIVFQNYALFPHLSVYDNVAYSLHITKRPREEIDERVYKILSAFHIEKHANKVPSQLSGGQQQRVALARAIINEPEVLLLDEPLAALDFKLRERMLVELIELQDKLKTTFIYVTHDQFEALTVADHMAIMNTEGTIEQIGTPQEIYEFPNSSFVARFVGSTNIFQGTIHNIDSSPEIDIPDLGSFKIVVPKEKQWITEGCSATMSLRPEKIFISKKPVKDFSNTVTGTVESIVYHGRSTQYNVLVNETIRVQVFEQNEEHFPHEEIDYDETVHLYWQKENVVLLER